MKAPDKIYLQELNDGTWDDCFVYESSETDTNGKKRVPYIRKETLIELINKKLQESADRLDYTTNKAYAEILDKLNSM